MQADVVDRTVELTIGDVPAVVVDAAFDPFSRKVAVTISDNGCGMDENTMKRAFDPFFSMRPAGRRRGMGLPKALRWVEASGGAIRLESRQGQGTRSIVLLPVSQCNVADAP